MMWRRSDRPRAQGCTTAWREWQPDGSRLGVARHGQSMEADIRTILRAAVAQDTPTHGLGTAIHALFAGQGGDEPVRPPRLPGRGPPRFT